MNHDPMCPVAPGRMLIGVVICECEGPDSLIARVRADEAAKYFGIGEVFDRGGYERGVKEERERAAERVLATAAHRNTPPLSVMYIDHAVAAARGGE